jgi:hypothetical protein
LFVAVVEPVVEQVVEVDVVVERPALETVSESVPGRLGHVRLDDPRPPVERGERTSGPRDCDVGPVALDARVETEVGDVVPDRAGEFRSTFPRRSHPRGERVGLGRLCVTLGRRLVGRAAGSPVVARVVDRL